MGFIRQNQSHFVFVYSPAHFSDLMKSYQKCGGNIYFEKDLERLETVCETHLMVYSNKKLNLYRCPPTEFMEKEGKDYPVSKFFLNPNLIKESIKIDGWDLYGFFSESLKAISFGKVIELPLIGCFSNAFELLNCSLNFIEKMMTDKEFVRIVRKGATFSATDKEITSINDYNPNEVIEAINAFFARQGVGIDVEGIIKKVIIDEQKGNELLLFESLYVSLDMMRYHPDKRDLMNILTDAEHAYYGGHCDVLVTNDMRMKYKTEAVYSYYGITTEIVCKQDLLDYLKNVIAAETDIKEPLNTVLSNQHIPEDFDEDSVYCKWTRLDNPVWGYFNKLDYFLNLSTKQGWFTFSRKWEFEKCTFYTETDKFIEIMKMVFRKPEIIDAFETEFVEKYKANDSSALFSFYFSNDVIATLGVTKEENTLVPIMDLVYLGNKN